MKISRFLTIVCLVIVFAFVAVLPVLALDGNPPPPLFDWAAISQALQNLALLTIPALGAFVVRWLNAKYQSEKAQLSEWQQQALEVFIRTCVYAAEQMKASEYIDNKLDYATDLVQMWLDAHGLTMDAIEIRARIEATVKEELNNDPAPVPTG